MKHDDDDDHDDHDPALHEVFYLFQFYCNPQVTR